MLHSPLAQSSNRGVLADRAEIEAHLEQEPIRATDFGAGRNAQHRTDLVTIEFGTQRVDFLLFAQCRDAMFKFVVGP